jgi:hypothetical protein
VPRQRAATTDPQLNAWFDPDPQTGKVGDICNGQTDTITVNANTWAVQKIYSATDDLDGSPVCQSQASSPEPPRPDAP